MIRPLWALLSSHHFSLPLSFCMDGCMCLYIKCVYKNIENTSLPISCQSKKMLPFGWVILQFPHFLWNISCWQVRQAELWDATVLARLGADTSKIAAYELKGKTFIVKQVNRWRLQTEKTKMHPTCELLNPHSNTGFWTLPKPHQYQFISSCCEPQVADPGINSSEFGGEHPNGHLGSDPAKPCSCTNDLEKGEAPNTNNQGFLGHRFLTDGH